MKIRRSGSLFKILAFLIGSISLLNLRFVILPATSRYHQQRQQQQQQPFSFPSESSSSYYSEWRKVSKKVDKNDSTSNTANGTVISTVLWIDGSSKTSTDSDGHLLVSFEPARPLSTSPPNSSSLLFCVTWNVNIDEWWTHHWQWRIRQEMDRGYCLQKLKFGTKRYDTYEKLYRNQFRGNCNQTLSKRMW